jgi:hypothetical protein
LRVDTAVHTPRGRLELRPGLGVVNGGPRLVRRGHADITAEAEGFDHADDPGFYYDFGLRRNPRTVAGVERDGDLLLVAVDGGGSTTMVIRGTVVTRPSDATGERPIGDAILVAP